MVLEAKATLELWVIQALMVCLEVLAPPGLREKEVLRDQRDILECLVLMDSMDPLETKDPKVPMESLVFQDLQAQLDLP